MVEAHLRRRLGLQAHFQRLRTPLRRLDAHAAGVTHLEHLHLRDSFQAGRCLVRGELRVVQRHEGEPLPLRRQEVATPQPKSGPLKLRALDRFDRVCSQAP